MSRICHVNIRKRDGLMTIARVDEHTIVVHGNTFSLPQKHVISISRSSSASIPRLGHRGREFTVESPMGSGEDNPGGTSGGVGGIVRGAVLKALVVFGGVLLIRRLRRSTTRWDHARAVADALSGEKVSAPARPSPAPPREIELAPPPPPSRPNFLITYYVGN
jgi:hypothetical protein